MNVTPQPANGVPGCSVGSQLEGRVVRRADLEDNTREAMFALLSGHFAGVDPLTFERDLSEKDCVILLEDAAGHLRGFSTIAVYSTDAPGRRVTVVYSGDTIVAPSWWGSPALPRTWIRAVRQLAHDTVDGELYWLLLTSGFRTYRFLPVFFQDFYPRYDVDSLHPSSALLQAIASERFPQHYDADDGIVRFAKPQVLVPELLELPEGRTVDPHVAYFMIRNPGYVAGDELVCLARIDDSNLTGAGRRMVRGAQQR